MAGIVEFFNEVGEKPALAGNLAEVIAGPTPDKDEILKFFKDNDYEEVGEGDVAKLIEHRNNLKEDFGIGEGVDY